MTHTQGKWAVVKTTGTDIKCGDTYVAGIHSQDKRIENIDKPYSLGYDTSETDANANLIASAPEMLEVLNYIVDECEKMKVADHGANGIYDDTPIHQIRETLYRVLRLFNKKAKAVTTEAGGK